MLVSEAISAQPGSKILPRNGEDVHEDEPQCDATQRSAIKSSGHKKKKKADTVMIFSGTHQLQPTIFLSRRIRIARVSTWQRAARSTAGSSFQSLEITSPT